MTQTKLNMFLIMFFLIGCGQQPIPARLLERGPSPMTTLEYKWTPENCSFHRHQMFLEGCITEEEFDALRELDGVPFCVRGKLFVWSHCSILGG